MGEGSAESLAGFTASQRAQAWGPWLVLQPAVEGGVALTAAADSAGVPLRTAQRWMAAYRSGGLAALARPRRSDTGVRRTRPELVALIEGLALRRPAPSVATIARRAEQAARERGWEAPSNSTVYAIVSALDPALVTLALEGSSAFRDRHELVYRRRADHPNAIWQADHTQLDIVVLDADGQPARPWLTVILDDNSRAIAGDSVFLGAPSALNLSLALRQAIWVNGDPRWVVHGIPDVLHVDHGSDFTSHHLTASRRRPALPDHLLRRRTAPGPRQARAAVRNHHFPPAARASRPPEGRQCRQRAALLAARPGRRDRPWDPQALPTTRRPTARPASNLSRRGSPTAGSRPRPSASRTSTSCS